MENLSKTLHKNNTNIKSTATHSIPSSVRNVSEVHNGIKVEDTLSAVGWEFMRSDLNGNDGGVELMAKQRGFKMINPTEEWFPGLDKLQSEFESWDWTYGKTPKFTITRSFKIPQEIINSNQTEEIVINIEVDKGLISTLDFHLPLSFQNQNSAISIDNTITALCSLKGQRFSHDIITADLLSANQATVESRGRSQFVTACVKNALMV